MKLKYEYIISGFSYLMAATITILLFIEKPPSPIAIMASNSALLFLIIGNQFWSKTKQTGD